MDAVLGQINEYLLTEVIDLVPGLDNWSKEQMLDRCKICDELLPEEDHFNLFKQIGDDTWCMDFHYRCSIIPEYVEAFKDADVDGWVPSHD